MVLGMVIIFAIARAKLSFVRKFSIMHVCREANQVAHCLADLVGISSTFSAAVFIF